MKTAQLSLFTELPRADATHAIHLERKPYIQPFECILAHAEVQGLIQAEENGLFTQAAERHVTVSAEQADALTLKGRLAYWQQVSADQVYVTDQVRYELADDPAVTLDALLTGDLSPEQLPNRRKLRYGPHDLHEYRGKFFPQLVKSLINAAGLEKGSVVLDPTCGSGTANCEARAMGMQTLGLDLNPLSVLIARTKAALLDLTPAALLAEAARIHTAVATTASANPADRWDVTDLDYLNRWFDSAALTELAHLLNVVEVCQHPVLLAWLRVCLSNVIRPISWQKESDLRVRKQIADYFPGTAARLFQDEVRRQVEKLHRYLALLETQQPFPPYEIHEGDARRIDQHLAEWVSNCDMLITSPPYATALPYIDTDRLSLVALNLLPRAAHRDREYQMIGNREILESQRQELWRAYQTRRGELPESVCALIDSLAEAYHTDAVGFRRRNLPALLARYYLDMLDAMTAARRMMRPNSLAFYIVGNNSTRVEEKRVEIPTDRFLWEIGVKAGWHQEQYIPMELLPSRDIFRENTGTSESILVFRSTVKRAAIYGIRSVGNGAADEGWDFAAADTQQHLHALHPYPARFIPQIPAKAIAAYTQPGDCVLDPFCGGGTTLLESILLGRPAIGIDNNAVACLISRAKTAPYTPADLACLTDFLNRVAVDVMAASPSQIWLPEYKNRDYWFAPAALHDLGRLRYAINQLPEPAHSFALTVFSALIVRASYQDSDTRYARVDKVYQPGSAVQWYQQKLSVALATLKEIADLPKATAAVRLTDGRDLRYIPDASVDFLVTSPPYLNAYDYHKYHRHRLHWIGGDIKLARDCEIGGHDTFTRPHADPQAYFDTMTTCFREWVRVLKPESHALVVIGDAIVDGQAVPVADRFIDIFARLDMPLAHRWLRNLQTSKKSFNQQARIKQEHVLLFQKKSHPRVELT
jgi:site-specific DNA-methyltransferase (cytosine-N4-specific)